MPRTVTMLASDSGRVSYMIEQVDLMTTQLMALFHKTSIPSHSAEITSAMHSIQDAKDALCRVRNEASVYESQIGTFEGS